MKLPSSSEEQLLTAICSSLITPNWPWRLGPILLELTSTSMCKLKTYNPHGKRTKQWLNTQNLINLAHMLLILFSVVIFNLGSIIRKATMVSIILFTYYHTYRHSYIGTKLCLVGPPTFPVLLGPPLTVFYFVNLNVLIAIEPHRHWTYLLRIVGSAF